MDRIVTRAVVLGVLIFGLCEADWHIEDDWMKNVPPVSELEIQARGDQRLLAIEESIKLAENSIKQHEQEQTRLFDEYIAAIKPSGQNSTVPLDPTKRELASARFDHRHNSETHAISRLEAQLDVLELQKLRTRLQIRRSLANSRQGIHKKSRFEVKYPSVKIGLNVPHGKTAVCYNDVGRSLKFGDLWISLRVDVGDLFKFNLKESGVHLSQNQDDTYREGYITSAGDFCFYDYDDASDTPRYQVEVTYNALMKQTVLQIHNSTAPDGKSWVKHETITTVKNDTLTTACKVFSYVSGTWIPADHSINTVDLNGPQEEVVLEEPCQSSLTVKKYEGDQAVREKRLICRSQ